MTQSTQKVKVKLEIKGSPKLKWEYEGRRDQALNLTLGVLQTYRKHVCGEE